MFSLDHANQKTIYFRPIEFKYFMTEDSNRRTEQSIYTIFCPSALRDRRSRPKEKYEVKIDHT